MKGTGEPLGQKTSMLCAQERGVMKTPDKSLARCRESKKRRNVCLTSQGSGGNKLHKEGHKQKCKGASERFIRSLWCTEGGLGRKWTPH